MRSVTCAAPGKVILFGEHSVVYEQPAVVIALDRCAHTTAGELSDLMIRINAPDLGKEGTFPLDQEFSGDEALKPIWVAVRTTLDHIGIEETGIGVSIKSDIPTAAGLGSSAAVAVSTVMAVSKVLGIDLELNEVSNLAYEAEKIVHGTPSGIDNSISTFGGAIRFQRGVGISQLELAEEIPLVIGDTGVERSTKDLVFKVRDRKEIFPTIMEPVIETMGVLAEKSIEVLAEGNLEALATLMDMNQGLLDTIGVNHEALSKLIFAAKSAGALGAKLTGAGGGGCMVALAPRDTSIQEAIAKAIERAGGKPISAATSLQGVRIE